MFAREQGLNPKDASDLELANGDIVRVISRWGEMRAEAKVTDTSLPGVVTMGLHFIESPNALINLVVDPVAKVPETKICAVRIIPEA